MTRQTEYDRIGGAVMLPKNTTVVTWDSTGRFGECSYSAIQEALRSNGVPEENLQGSGDAYPLKIMIRDYDTFHCKEWINPPKVDDSGRLYYEYHNGVNARANAKVWRDRTIKMYADHPNQQRGPSLIAKAFMEAIFTTDGNFKD